MNVEELRSILAQANNGEDVDRGISKMNNILINAAKKASFTKRSANEKKVTKQHTHEWHDRECKARQRILRQCSKKVSLSRHKFIKARANYKKVCRKAESASRRKLTKKMN